MAAWPGVMVIVSHDRGPAVRRLRRPEVRAGLARFLLLAQPPPQLLILDEPTNSLDLASVRHLSGALRAYRGAVIVASHDDPFLKKSVLTGGCGSTGPGGWPTATRS